MATFGQQREEEREAERFTRRSVDTDSRAKHLFGTIGSHGANKKKLAQLCATWDYVMSLLGWDETLSEIVTGYQASINARYHTDYKDVATIEELDRRIANRRSMRGQREPTQTTIITE